MNGPHHYREAERLIGMIWEEGRTQENVADLIQRAQVHATLAAATANVELVGVLSTAHDVVCMDLDAWNQALSEGGAK